MKVLFTSLLINLVLSILFSFSLLSSSSISFKIATLPNAAPSSFTQSLKPVFCTHIWFTTQHRIIIVIRSVVIHKFYWEALRVWVWFSLLHHQDPGGVHGILLYGWADGIYGQLGWFQAGLAWLIWHWAMNTVTVGLKLLLGGGHGLVCRGVDHAVAIYVRE